MRLQFLPGIMVALVSLLHTNAYAQLRDQGSAEWRTFEVPEFGTRIQIPASVFAPAGKPERGSGQRFERADGRAVLSIYSRTNDTGENPTTYLRHNLRMDRAALDYVRITRSFFAISSEQDDPLTLSDLAATLYHCLGIDGEKRLMAPGNRPVRIVDNGKPRQELLA